MPQGVEVIEMGRLMTERGEPILLRDDGGRWGLFLECRCAGLFGQRVTIRGIRFGFGMLHVTGIGRASQVPPQPRDANGLLIGALVAIQIVAIGPVLKALGGAAWRLLCAMTGTVS